VLSPLSASFSLLLLLQVVLLLAVQHRSVAKDTCHTSSEFS
jgi:hypothetical protein